MAGDALDREIHSPCLPPRRQRRRIPTTHTPDRSLGTFASAGRQLAFFPDHPIRTARALRRSRPSRAWPGANGRSKWTKEAVNILVPIWLTAAGDESKCRKKFPKAARPDPGSARVPACNFRRPGRKSPLGGTPNTTCGDAYAPQIRADPSPQARPRSLPDFLKALAARGVRLLYGFLDVESNRERTDWTKPPSSESSFHHERARSPPAQRSRRNELRNSRRDWVADRSESLVGNGSAHGRAKIRPSDRTNPALASVRSWCWPP